MARKNTDYTNIPKEKFEFVNTNEKLTDKKFDTKYLEMSSGTYEIKDDKLYYYRENIEQQSDDINIPKVSVFKIEGNTLILQDNYLEKYQKNIIFKSPTIK